MKFTTISRRIAATGAVTAMAAGALVGLTGTTATAAPEVTNDYTCSVPGLAGPYNVTMLTEAVGIEGFPQINAGADLPAGLLTVTNHVTIPAEAYGLFSQFGVDNVTFPDMAADFGANKVGVEGMTAKVADMTANEGGTTYSFDAPGSNAAFQTPVAGEYDILMPTGFTINANNAEGTTLAPIVCNLAEGQTAQSLHHIMVVKNDTATTGEATKKQFTVGRKAKVAAAVTGGTQLEGDKVLLKKGTKTLDSALLGADGTATLVTKKLPVGKNKLKVVYKATGYNNGSKSDTVIVKVVP
jgi:hypothetical protein